MWTIQTVNRKLSSHRMRRNKHFTISAIVSETQPPARVRSSSATSRCYTCRPARAMGGDAARTHVPAV
jgi:hypothetical protein